MSETITVHAEPINVDTPFGKALCIAWYDYGFWTETQWKCVVQEGGHIVFVPHQDIRITHQYSARVKSSKPPSAPSYMAKVLKNDPGVPVENFTKADLSYVIVPPPDEEDGA